MGWSVKKLEECIENNYKFGYGAYCYIHDAHAPKARGKWAAVLKGIREGRLTVQEYGHDNFIIRKKGQEGVDKIPEDGSI
jgi:hypothetical protein